MATLLSATEQCDDPGDAKHWQMEAAPCLLGNTAPVEPFPHLNDADASLLVDTVDELQRPQRLAHPPVFTRDNTYNSDNRAIGGNLAALEGELNRESHSALLQAQLRSLNENVAAVVAGQDEIRLALKLLSSQVQVRPGVGYIDGTKGVGDGMHMNNVSPPSERKSAVRRSAAPRKNDDENDPSNDIVGQAKRAEGGEESLPLSTGSSEHPWLKRSRSNFKKGTAEQDLQELRGVVTRAEDIERSTQKRSGCGRLRNLTKHEQELIVDIIIGIVICLNALFIGYSIDAPPSHANVVFGLDYAFSAVFMIELILKLCINGVKGQFCGESWKMNVFDALLILVDTLQLILTQVLDAVMMDLPSVSLFRVLRLVRLARLLRLLRFEVFDDLVAMVGGMTGGATTLFWAMVLYMFSIYVVSLVFREFLGNKQVENVYEYFDGVPRAMITVFRCSFGDCSSLGGVPIFEHVQLHYGIAYTGIYFLFTFAMTVGLFNVISAIFVDATMAAAASMRSKQKKERLTDNDLWSTNIYILMKKLAEHADLLTEAEGDFVEQVDGLYEMDVETDAMRDIAKDPEVQRALNELDVDPEDHENLAVILDPDQGGSITVVELVDGIKRLRGDPKRSDIVQIEILLRSISTVVQEIKGAVVQPEPLSPTASVLRKSRE
eukprot:TRINITY_DN24324_c0_g2_i1.p1 TRINITY_DN24324_c0_g2~~TRINITY_DN24324_c0_g2_i1.p1  ORF type:complete len:663 (+),score=146.22 TRINITY_DN24324_c0_g2_i1:74-2062(+)